MQLASTQFPIEMTPEVQNRLTPAEWDTCLYLSNKIRGIEPGRQYEDRPRSPNRSERIGKGASDRNQFRRENAVTHKHFCLKCSTVVAEGDFDCERDTDHDTTICCSNCVALTARTEAYLRHLKQQSQIRAPR
jgi:hypothetical protein